jgi:excisionase family DNA binding protein
MDTRHLTIREAAAQLRVSTRTINRRIRAGTLTETQRDGIRYVVLADVPAQTCIETPTTETHDKTDRDTETLVSELRDRLQATESDRDHWRHQAETLSRNVSELTTTLYHLSERKMLPAPNNQTNTPRHWWQLWKLGPKPRGTSVDYP